MGIVLVAGVLMSCSGREVERSTSIVERYQLLSLQRYGKDAECIMNPAQTAVLCMKHSKPTAQVPQRQVSFFLYDIAADKVTFEDNLPNGSVEWKDDRSVMVTIVPGIEKSDDQSPPRRHGYVVDVFTGKTKDMHDADVD